MEQRSRAGRPHDGPPGHARRSHGALWFVVTVAALAVLVCSCGSGAPHVLPPATSPSASTTTTVPSLPTSVPSQTTRPPSATTTPTTTAPVTTAPVPPPLELGSTGPAVMALQQRLVSLRYWLGTPNGTFGDSTQQAVYALQKAAGISRDGIVGPETEAALAQGIVPQPEPSSGYLIEVDLADDLLMFVTNGTLEWTLNTSTGGGYVYTGGAVAVTPVGTFTIFREVDGMVVDSLGELWRPKFFVGGVAIHGDSYVPPEPVSHGCVRVSNEAIDWIWTGNMAPMGTTVWVYT